MRLTPRPGRHDPTRNPDGTAAVVLHAYSPAVLPRPDDWPAAASVTGYWFLDANSTLPDDVEKFLADGPAPIFAGFGSMTGVDPVQTATAVVEAAAIADARLILGAGWGGLDADAATAAAGRPASICAWSTTWTTGACSRGFRRWSITAAPAPPAQRSPPADHRWSARLLPISRSGPGSRTSAESRPTRCRSDR